MSLIGKAAENMIEMFERAGYSAYVSGKCMRDILMGKMPQEIEISTSASLREVRFLFQYTAEFGNYVTVTENRTAFVVRQYKSKNDEKKDIYTDISCRDFTMNAIAYAHDIVDVYKGREDIENKLIRCAGNAEESFKEYPIRMLRAVRYACSLDFSIEEETKNAIKKYGYLLVKVNQNKIREELNKILMSKQPDKIVLLHELGILKYVMKELEVCFSTPQRNKYHIYNVGEHIIQTVKNTPNDLLLRWAALLHDIGKPDCLSTDSSGIIHFYGHHKQSAVIADNILYRLRFPSEFIEDISVLIENHDVRIEPETVQVKRMMARTGSELFEKLLILQRADASAKNQIFLQEKIEKLEEVREIYKIVIEEKHPYLISQLLVGKKDLMKIGVKQGREMSEIFRALLEEVIINPKLNNRDYLIKKAKSLK